MNVGSPLTLPGQPLTITSLNAPTGVAVTQLGTPGAASYQYYVVATSYFGDTTTSTYVTTTTGNATLSATNYNQIAWNRVVGATGYKVIRNSGTGGAGTIVTITDPSITQAFDTGQAAGVYSPVTTNPMGQLIVQPSGQSPTADYNAVQLFSGTTGGAVRQLFRDASGAKQIQLVADFTGGRDRGSPHSSG